MVETEVRLEEMPSPAVADARGLDRTSPAQANLTTRGVVARAVVVPRSGQEPGAAKLGESGEAPPEGSEPAGVVAAPGGTGWSLQPERGIDLTAGAVARAPRPIVEAAPWEPGPTPGGVAEALDAHDSAIGMGRGGPVLTALESAAAGEDAPFEGGATFDVAIQADGHVSMALLDATSAAEGWRRIGEATGKGFDGTRVRVPPGARGWHVVVHVEAKVQYPNGLDPTKLGTKFVTSSKGVAFVAAGKVCTVRLDLGLTLFPISGGCDPSNIGARPLRVVHGHIVGEGRL